MTEAEKREFFDFEKYAQMILDGYYESRNHTVDRTSACKKYDCIIDGQYKVEEKFRQEEYGDILIEVIQDMNTNAPGWFFETGCNYLHYVFIENSSIKRFIRINWDKFKSWCLSDYFVSHKHPNTVISPRGWGLTVNLSVPINDIPKYIKLFDDRPETEQGAICIKK